MINLNLKLKKDKQQYSDTNSQNHLLHPTNTNITLKKDLSDKDNNQNYLLNDTTANITLASDQLQIKTDESQQEVIHMIGDFDYNMTQVLKQVVAQIQDKYDLDAPIVIGAWLAEDGFKEGFERKAQEVYRKHLKQSKLSGFLEELLNVSNPDDFVENRMNKEFEKCGYVLDSSSNGYFEYCNCHKYLHKITYNLRDMEIERGKESDSKNNTNHNFLNNDRVILGKKNHFFIRKTSTQILDEAIFRLKFNIFLGFTRKLVKIMVEEFIEWIRQRYRIGFVPQKDWQTLALFLSQNRMGVNSRKRGVFRSKIAFLDRVGNSYCKIYIDHGIGINGFEVLESLGKF